MNTWEKKVWVILSNNNIEFHGVYDTLSNAKTAKDTLTQDFPNKDFTIIETYINDIHE